jgi:hypothetical protein
MQDALGRLQGSLQESTIPLMYNPNHPINITVTQGSVEAGKHHEMLLDASIEEPA